MPYYQCSQHIETAKHLRLTMTRYLAERASLDDVKEAYSMFVACAPVKGEKGYRGGDQ